MNVHFFVSKTQICESQPIHSVTQHHTVPNQSDLPFPLPGRPIREKLVYCPSVDAETIVRANAFKSELAACRKMLFRPRGPNAPLRHCLVNVDKPLRNISTISIDYELANLNFADG